MKVNRPTPNYTSDDWGVQYINWGIWAFKHREALRAALAQSVSEAKPEGEKDCTDTSVWRCNCKYRPRCHHILTHEGKRVFCSEGYAVVAIEPTKEMALMGARAGAALLSPDDARDVYKAMIAAQKKGTD